MVSLRRRKTKSNAGDDSTAPGTLEDPNMNMDSQFQLDNTNTHPSNANKQPTSKKGGVVRKKFNLEEAYANHRRRQRNRAAAAFAGKKPKVSMTLKAKHEQEGNVSSVPSDISLQNDPDPRSSFIENDNSELDGTQGKTSEKSNENPLLVLPQLPSQELEMSPADDDDDDEPKEASGGPRSAMSTASIQKDESKLKKIAVRLFYGIMMVLIFLSVMYSGHIYLCGLIFFTEVMLYRELVTVRYNTFFHIIEETIPLFRTTQWMWFVTAIFYTYGDFVVEIIKSNTSLHYLLNYARFQGSLAFLLYSATFVTTIATMQKDYIRFQLNQLCWTVTVLCLTVGQLKYIMHNVYNGLFWFALPIMLVVFNDSFAWLAGITCGKKFIQREFISLSPNKTWEGFIGGWIGTMIAGWHLSRFMTQFTWMTCPTNNFSLLPSKLECELDPVFQPATNIIPSQVFELAPSALVQMIPGVVRICMVDGESNNLTACVSGEDRHSHHHFELNVKNVYPVQIHALGLSLFASFVAPFGGFLASAIKRAYRLKDFASYIPGHGGMMDRMDCQLLMALCTWVHYNTFVKMATVSVPKMIYMYKLMKESDQQEFLKQIGAL